MRQRRKHSGNRENRRKNVDEVVEAARIVVSCGVCVTRSHTGMSGAFNNWEGSSQYPGRELFAGNGGIVEDFPEVTPCSIKLVCAPTQSKRTTVVKIQRAIV